ncbi:MAG: hypothetical protein P1Q69_02360 [Candidatus Thorarchaeota archaeon]|nr:hypothetical protein [Candidatus Thorarchaeota archaeon]
MLRINKLPKLVVIAMTLMIVLSSVQGTVSAQVGELDPIVVMYEANHGPQFAADDAENGFKLMLDMVNASTRYIVRVNEEPLNATILNDVDILILAAPDTAFPFENEEFIAIDEMMKNGSSLLVLGNPRIDQNSTYWDSPTLFNDLGETRGVNNFLDGMNITGVRFSENGTEDFQSGDAMFDYEHSLNSTYPSIIQLDATTWDNTHPIFRDINTLVTMTGTLKPLEASTAVATSYDTSFAQYRKGPYTFANYSYPNMTLAEFAEQPQSYSAINGTHPSWVSAFEYDNSKVIIAGSALMFSGRLLDMPESELEWFYQGDNARFFMNMMGWLSDGFVESPDAIIPIAILSSIFLVAGVVVYLFKKM